jgi:hypothetical protein
LKASPLLTPEKLKRFSLLRYSWEWMVIEILTLLITPIILQY